jgi:hypothetical protein
LPACRSFVIERSVALDEARAEVKTPLVARLIPGKGDIDMVVELPGS